MHRILTALLMAAASFAAHAAGPQEASPPLSHAASSDQHAETIEIRAVVVDAAGAPVEGAVVVTSAGGQGVTDHTGAARFNVSLDPSTDSLHITAAAVIRGANHVGNVRLDTLNSTTSIDAGVITLAAGADCEPAWIPTFGGRAGVIGNIFALAIFDDGSGPALYAGGYFTTAGGVEASRIAKWDGVSWSQLGSGINSSVLALTVFDDGSGPALYAGGSFTTAGGVTVNHIAKWDGAVWSPLGSGMSGGFGHSSEVHALTVFDDGTGGGPALYAGGNFTTAGGVSASRIAKWNGAVWSSLGDGVGGSSIGWVRALTVFDDGSGGGPALYAGGSFTTAGGVSASRIAKWDGATWSPLGSGMNGSVRALTVFDDGSGAGQALYAGGLFSTASGVSANRIAKWDGATWSPLGSGMNGSIRALTVFDDGSGAGQALYAGGGFSTAGGVSANRIAKWDGASWSPQLGSGINSSVLALTVFDDGSGPALYAGGQFTTAGGVEANHIAKWDGAAWSPLGSGINNSVHALTVFDDGSGDGPALYAGGQFTTAGGVEANRIAKWDGAVWSPLGSGMNDSVSALTVFDDGSGAGPALFVGGSFTTAGGETVNHIAKWDGSSWSPLGSGMSSTVWVLTVFDDGSGGGPALYAGGAFATAGGVEANRIAKWDGAYWSPLGSGMSGYASVRALTVFDDGSGGGPALYAGGQFTTAGSETVKHIAKWDGASWSPLGSGMNNAVRVFTVFDHGSGSGPALYAGGAFTASPGGDSYLAKWQGCPVETIPADLNGDGVVNAQDLGILLGSWGVCPDEPAPCPADINGDGRVNAQDLGILLGFWGATSQ